MHQHGSNYFTDRYNIDPGGGVKSSKKMFSQNIHVAYQIRVNVAYSTMQAHFLSLNTPSARWVGVKTFFSVAYQIKGNGA